ncbi:MAG: hypothetical protein ABL911_04960 [Gallionella sp.]
MTTASTRAPARKAAAAKLKKVNIQKLSSKQLDALPEEVFLASLSPWARKFMKAAEPFRGKLKMQK